MLKKQVNVIRKYVLFCIIRLFFSAFISKTFIITVEICKGRNPVFPAGKWLQYETISRWILNNVGLNWTNGLLRLINSMYTELIRPVNYNPGICQKPIKLEISSCRCSKLQFNDESGETEGYSALYTPLLPLKACAH